MTHLDEHSAAKAEFALETVRIAAEAIAERHGFTRPVPFDGQEHKGNGIDFSIKASYGKRLRGKSVEFGDGQAECVIFAFHDTRRGA